MVMGFGQWSGSEREAKGGAWAESKWNVVSRANDGSDATLRYRTRPKRAGR